MSSRRWTYGVLVIALSLTSAVIGINCVVDTYGLLRKDFSRQYQEPNLRFVKMKYVLHHPGKYDSFLFGSSRGLQIDTKKIPGGSYYNMSYSEGLPEEHLGNIKLLLESGIRIRNLIIALDDFSGLVSPEKHQADLLRQQHYLVSGKRPVVFYGEYYAKSKRVAQSVRRYLVHNYTARGRVAAQKTFYDLADSGRVICTTCDDDIERDTEAHVKDPKFDHPFHYDGNNVDAALGAMRKIADLAMQYDIRLVVLINPIHRTTYLDTNRYRFLEFKRGLAAITDYYDFSGLNAITVNNYLYHETSHFRERVGDMMLKRIFGVPRIASPGEFGVFVTSDSVESHLRRLTDQLLNASSAKGRARRTEGALFERNTHVANR